MELIDDDNNWRENHVRYVVNKEGYRKIAIQVLNITLLVLATYES